MSIRLESILRQLTQQYAPSRLSQMPADLSRFAFLADALTKEGVLILWADLPRNLISQAGHLITLWVNQYADLYIVLGGTLFAAYTPIRWRYADQRLPVIIIIEADVPAVIRALAAYIVPYVVHLQRLKYFSEPELRGVLSTMLEDFLGADNMDRDQLQHLRNITMQRVRDIVQQPLRHRPLTTAAAEVPTITLVELMPTSNTQKPPPGPLPETGPLKPAADDTVNPQDEPPIKESDTGPLGLPKDVPIFFNGRYKGKNKYTPPVPQPPKRDDAEDDG